MEYKLLDENGCACNQGSGQWSLPIQLPDGSQEPGEWMPEIVDIEICVRGYHSTDLEHMLEWNGDSCYELEGRGRYIVGEDEHEGKTCRAQARLLRRLNWSPAVRGLLACDYAEHVLPIYDAAHPGGAGPRDCIEVTRRYLRGTATLGELESARDAAWDAWAAASAAAWAVASAASAAASAAAWDARAAASAAAWDARAAASAAAWDARAAASAAAWDARAAASAASAAASAAAWDARAAASAAERDWQVERLRQYLYGEL